MHTVHCTHITVTILRYLSVKSKKSMHECVWVFYFEWPLRVASLTASRFGIYGKQKVIHNGDVQRFMHSFDVIKCEANTHFGAHTKK